MFVDQSGFYLLPTVVRTYAPIGQTPILREHLSRDHLSVISAITLEGKLLMMEQERSFKNEVEKVRYATADNRVYINNDQYFEGVPEEVWEFRVGGYQVLDKWLKDRRGRTLSWEDTQHYQKVVVALSETRRLMTEIDEIIPGWPIE